MPFTPGAASPFVQLATARAINATLSHRGWTARPESREAHPGAVAVSSWTTATGLDEIRLLILSLGRLGQLIELTAEPLSAERPANGRRRSGEPAWRLTAYNAPAAAIAAAALTAAGNIENLRRLDTLGWTIERFRGRGGRLCSTSMTRLDRGAQVEFYTPALTPPCPSCAQPGRSADHGGWLITGPDFTADATTHTPDPVITAFALAIPTTISLPPTLEVRTD
jgi:hypothetical protein